MEVGAATARLASSVVMPVVRKLFVQNGPGAGLVEKPVRVSALITFRGEKRTLDEPDVRKLVRQLVERALSTVGPGERPIPEREERAVAEALADTLLGLGDIGMEDVQAVRLRPHEFARLLSDMGSPAKHGLSADGERFHAVLLETACLHILHFFTQRSSFVARTLVEQTRLLTESIERLDVVIDRLPAQSADDAAFERRYAEFITKKHRTLTIYGLDLHHSSEWPLETAYLSLQTAGSTQWEQAFEEPHHTGGGDPFPATFQSADRALASHDRVLLRGAAGSGKTTLVQWLAVTAARQDSTTNDNMSHLFDRVPFVLPLRTLTRSSAPLPEPGAFLTAANCPLASGQPAGWSDRVLTAGRGLLLVDGVDEIPESDRQQTRHWLRDLLNAFPGNMWLVTCRPSAVSGNWLEQDSFAELSLPPMGQTEVTTFIERWHAAAEADPALRDALLTVVRSKKDVSRLATNPLMCGLICALHRERRSFLPRGRKELYDAALDMLLERRDRERDMHRPSSIELDKESQVSLIQKLAYWLIRNGRAEIERSDAIDLLARVLPSMPHVSRQASAEDVFRHLLLRSGLLREPAPGMVDFIHRTFQDYLGAREAIEERDFDILVNNAHQDQWEDVVRMSVAYARPDERARLLKRLINRGDEEKECRARLHLLAMACLEHATKLDPVVRTDVEYRASELIPPRSFEEADALAVVGPVVLELLPGPEELDEDEALAVVHTAAEIGTAAALQTLVRFRECDFPPVLTLLAGHWGNFESATYTNEIIAHITHKPHVSITVRSIDELTELRRIGGAPRVWLHGDFTAQQLMETLVPDQLTELRIENNGSISSLHFLRRFPRLSNVEIRSCPEVADLSPLGTLPIQELRLWHLPKLRGLHGLHAMAQLSLLIVGQGVEWHDDALSHLPEEAPLQALELPSDANRLSRLRAWPHLERLNIVDREFPMTHVDWAAVASLSKLTSLSLRADGLRTVPHSGPQLPHLKSLSVVARHCRFDFSDVVRLFPGLERLSVVLAAQADVSKLAALPKLRRVRLVNVAHVLNAEMLPSGVQVVRSPRPRQV